MYDVIIIGCGITGAAIGYSLSKFNLKIAILERENDISCGTTKANSAILHAGYDPKPGTLMAKLNVRGSLLAKDICRNLDVPYGACGSMVLGFDETDLATVRKLFERGKANGVEGLRLLSGDEARAMEPNISRDVVGALYAPTASITSPWELCLALAETAVRNGTELHRNTEVLGMAAISEGWSISTGRGEFHSRFVINAAGVDADTVHNMAAEHSFVIISSRGEYDLLDKSEGAKAGCVLFQCPNPNGKGVLVTPTVHGNLLVGPTAEIVAHDDTSVTAEGVRKLRETAKRSVPGIDFRQTIRSFAGVRAISDTGDFVIGEAAPGFFDAAGICSPGLTAAPAIGEYLTGLLKAAGLELIPKENFINTRERVRFNELSDDKRRALVEENHAYGRIVCRCETVTEGEILDALNSPIPPVSVDGVKRRCNPGMGRCQGGFCAPRVVELLARHYGVAMDAIEQDKSGSWLLSGETKGGQAHV